MQISFPQKNTFGTVYANRVVTEEIDTAVGSLLFKRLGIDKFHILAGENRNYNHVGLATDRDLVDISGGVLISSDNSGHIDQLGVVLPDERVTVYAKNALEVQRTTAPYDHGVGGTDDFIRVTGNGDIYFFCSELPSLKNGKSIKLLEVKIGYRTTHLDDKFSDLRALTASTLVQPINDPSIQLFDNEVDVGAGATGDAVCTLTGATTLNAGDIVIIKGVTVVTTAIHLYGFSIKYEEV